MKTIGVAVLLALTLTLVIAGVAGAQSPVPYYGGYGYQPQPYYLDGYFTCPGGFAYPFPGNGNGADNRFGGGYFPPYRRFGGGYIYGPYLRFGGGYGVTPYSSGWSYWGY